MSINRQSSVEGIYSSTLCTFYTRQISDVEVPMGTLSKVEYLLPPASIAAAVVPCSTLNMNVHVAGISDKF